MSLSYLVYFPAFPRITTPATLTLAISTTDTRYWNILTGVPVSVVSALLASASTNHKAAGMTSEELSSTWKGGWKDPSRWASQWRLNSHHMYNTILVASQPTSVQVWLWEISMTVTDNPPFCLQTLAEKLSYVHALFLPHMTWLGESH